MYQSRARLSVKQEPLVDERVIGVVCGCVLKAKICYTHTPIIPCQYLRLLTFRIFEPEGIWPFLDFRRDGLWEGATYALGESGNGKGGPSQRLYS